MVTSELPDAMHSANRVEFAKTSSRSPSPELRAPGAGFEQSLTSASAQAAAQKAVEISARTGKPKRRKALRACGNCQRTHLTCDDNRPCERCIKRGCADTCADGVRKKMKYLDKNSRQSRAGLNTTFGSAPLPAIYAAHDGVFPEGGRASLSKAGHDTAVSGILELSHGPVAPLSPDNIPPSHVAHPDGLMMPSTDVLNHAHHGFLEHVIAPASTGPPTGRHLSDPALAPHHQLPTGAASASALPRLPHEASSSTYTTTAAAAALITPTQDPNAFHSYAADSEYTVVARMLENSRAKSDQEYSPADSPKFTSSNVDLRNFVNLQALPQEPGQSPADPGFSSWLDPPPPPPPAVVVQRRKSGMPNFKRVDSDGSDQSIGTVLPHPSDIYRNVREPYPYTPAFHGLLTFLKQRFAREQLMRIVRSMARIRPSFIAVTKDLTHEDLVFMEQCFQRSLLEYEKYFSYSGTPSIVWRRTGQIAAVAPEFCMLTQWPRHELRARFIVEVMSDESAVDYFERFSEMTFTDTKGQIMYECSLLTPMGQQIRTSAVLTVRKDLFGIPMTIIGNFLPHV